MWYYTWLYYLMWYYTWLNYLMWYYTWLHYLMRYHTWLYCLMWYYTILSLLPLLLKTLQNNKSKSLQHLHPHLLMCLQASSGSWKDWKRAVGMPCRDMNCLAKSLLASISAAAALGPKQAMPGEVSGQITTLSEKAWEPWIPREKV